MISKKEWKNIEALFFDIDKRLNRIERAIVLHGKKFFYYKYESESNKEIKDVKDMITQLAKSIGKEIVTIPTIPEHYEYQDASMERG
jgi:hypothetical protein